MEREPDNRHAHFCTGIILEQQGNLAGAHKHFQRVTELDPHDAISWYWTASTLTDRENPLLSTSPKLAKEQAALYSKALELDPYLTQAIYRLALAYSPCRRAAQAERASGTLGQDQSRPPAAGAGSGKLGREGVRRDGQVRHGNHPVPTARHGR